VFGPLDDVHLDVVAGHGLVEDLLDHPGHRELVELRERVFERTPGDGERQVGFDPLVLGWPCSDDAPTAPLREAPRAVADRLASRPP
jgi:hypothetical protein